MVGGLQSARSVIHLARVFALANEARLLPDPDLAATGCGSCSRRPGCEDDLTEVDVPSGPPARIATPPRRPRLTRLSLNQRTTAEWNLREAIEGCVARAAGHRCLARAGRRGRARGRAAMVEEAGLRVSSLCRGGFFTDPATVDARRTPTTGARSTRRRHSGAPSLVLVPGGLPPGDRDLPAARRRVADAVARLAPHARDAGVRLGIEPMHPMFAADRGVISTLAQALDIAERLDPSRWSASWSTRSTCGGSRASTSRSPGPATGS